MITGPSSGIGLATAVQMGRRGYHVVAAGRSEERIMAVVDRIVASGGAAEYLHLDLASLASAREAAHRFVSSGRVLDVLIDNAGVGGIRGTTEDGFEIHFGVNHLGHFMLTHHLRPAFRAGTRVVVVSSEVHRRADGIPFDRLRRKTRTPGGLPEYGVSKLANILFARHLASTDPDLRSYALHPGVVRTNIFPALAAPFFRGKITPEEGAEPSVWCATAPELADQSGGYYSRMRPREPSSTAQDADLAAELWERSAAWCGIAEDRGAGR